MMIETVPLHLTKAPVATAEMMIRRPVSEVFAALVDPEITSQFWFSHGSGPLEEGKRVQWDWEMYGFSMQVDVRDVKQNELIRVEWSSDDVPTTIEWRFKAISDETTFVSTTNYGFLGDGD